MLIVLSRVIEIFIAYFLLTYLCFYLHVSVGSHFWLIATITTWLCFGHHIKRKLKYQGIFASWYAPLTKINEWNLSIGFAILSIYAALQFSNSFQKDLFLASVIALSIQIFLCNYIYKPRSPLLALIQITSAIESFLIAILILIYTQVKFDNLITYTIFQNILLIMITICNYYFLRSFIFYQKLIIRNENSETKLSYNQKLNIAVHESSHLLMYIFYREVPHDIQILLFKEAKKINPSAQGLVMARVPIYNNSDFLKWRMMLSISGIRGELVIFGNHSHGSESDFQEWRELAHIYLSNFESQYIPQPIKTNELKNNKMLETKLYDEQIYIIDKFLKNNKRILLKISKQALVFNKLNYNQIYPHFKNIKTIKEMPKEK